MKDFKLVYTTGLFDYMLSDLRESVLSARRFLDKEDIIIIFTPPLDNKVIEQFSKLATIQIKDKNLTEAFNMHPYNKEEVPKRFGEKIYLCDIDCPNVMFIGCDTIVYNDPSRLFDEDYDFGSTALDDERNWTNQPWQIGRNLLGKSYDIYNIQSTYKAHLWNSDHIFFKNYTHKKIRHAWLKYFNDKKSLIELSDDKRTDDQLSLTPTLAEFPELKIKLFGPHDIYKVGWNRRYWKISPRAPSKTCVIHGDELADKLGMVDELNKLEKDLLNE